MSSHSHQLAARPPLTDSARAALALLPEFNLYYSAQQATALTRLGMAWTCYI
ncbi:MAG: hypothetical protein JWP57_4328 [Spirosoma sp.]|nr:hypothetical protein [Spirosoma sp.]